MPFAELAQRRTLVVLGIDPGTLSLGFGVVGREDRKLVAIDFGAFRASRSTALPYRLSQLSRGVEEALDHHCPDVVSLEEAFFLRNPQSTLRLGEARATVLLAAARRDIPVVQYATAVVKKTVCGHGGASKALVQQMVAQELGLPAPPEPHDAADALALALCLLFDPRLDRRLGEALREEGR